MPSPPSPRYVERMPTADDELSSYGETLLRIAAEPEPLMMSVKVCEPATTPPTREKAADSVSAERSSAPCTAAEGELSMARGLCHSKGGKAPDPELSPGRAPVPEFSPQRAPVPALRKCPPEPKSSSARSLKAYSRPRASRAPSSVSYNSRVQPWKAGISQIPALPPTIASSTAIVWQPLCGQSFP